MSHTLVGVLTVQYSLLFPPRLRLRSIILSICPALFPTLWIALLDARVSPPAGVHRSVTLPSERTNHSQVVFFTVASCPHSITVLRYIHHALSLRLCQHA